MKKHVLICICLFLTGIANLYGQGTGKEVSGHPHMLHFRFDKAIVDSGYANNRRTLTVLSSLFSDSALVSRIDSIHIYAFASPDGNEIYNNKLTHRRAVAIKGYLVWKYPYLNQYSIRLHSQGENWEGLRALIEQDENIPHREEVLMIMDKVTDNEKRKKLLKYLNGGRTYNYIVRNILPELRNAAVCMVWMKQADERLFVSRETTTPLLIEEVQGVVDKKFLSEHDNYKVFFPTTTPSPSSIRRGTKKQPFLALKTNMLFDLAMMPNVEVEIPVCKRWSVNSELMFPWWLFDGDKYCLQIFSGGLEGRYWLGNRKKREVLTGHFAGLYAGGGKYDLQWKENGYQGEFFIAAGISYGYAKRIARNLHLEFNIGVGLLRTTYSHYHANDNYQTLLWQSNGRYTWFGPTKAKISLVWMLNHSVKKGGMK